MARTLYRALAVLSLGLLSGLAFAQDSEPYAADPPDRAARLSFISGDVSLQPAGESDWAPALVNRPLTTGDKLWTDRDSRAEIYVGPAAVRLDGNTGFSFLNVDDDTIQMRVTAGIVSVNVRTLDGGEHIEIDTPNVALSLLRAGNYRVEVDDAGDVTVVKVSEGSVQATGPSVDTIVYAQQVVTIRGTDDLLAQYGTLGAPDDFDSWSLERDRHDEQAANSRTAEYVSPDVTGYQDLDANGTWSSEPEYGYVWAPSYVGVDWAPYRYGRWVSISPWGWTWIDDASWGYAPSHYGRWAHIRNRWCWVPGPRHSRAVYAPALVGWGGSPGLNVSWFPLGPREVYVPGRHYSRRYVERVNFSNSVINRLQFRDVYENRVTNPTFQNRVAGAVTAATRSSFTSAGRIGPHRVRLNEQELAASPASAMAPRIAPVRESRMGGSARANVRVPPQTVANRQVVVRRDPPPAAAHFARRPSENRDVARVPDRVDRPQNRGQEQRQPDVAATLRDRADRPPTVDRPPRDRPVSESAPPTRSSVFDRQALSDRVREDRDRQVREGQQQRETLQQREDSQQREAQQQRLQRQDEQARQQREQSQVSRELQQQLRERVQRQQESREQPAQRERSTERPSAQRPQVDRTQERPQERPRVEQPRAEQPRAEQPRVEQPHRSESRPPAETRSQPRNREDGNTRSKRD